ncbi:hypothetical protein OS31_36950 [Dickeya oryzae]
MSTHDMSVGTMNGVISTVVPGGTTQAELVARLERMPITRQLMTIRVVVGLSTFFDAYTVLAIAFAMPQLAAEWGLNATDIGMIIAASYVGQLFGAVFFWLSGRKDWPSWRIKNHDYPVCYYGCILPIRLERYIHDGISFPARCRYWG